MSVQKAMRQLGEEVYMRPSDWVRVARRLRKPMLGRTRNDERREELFWQANKYLQQEPLLEFKELSKDQKAKLWYMWKKGMAARTARQQGAMKWRRVEGLLEASERVKTRIKYKVTKIWPTRRAQRGRPVTLKEVEKRLMKEAELRRDQCVLDVQKLDEEIKVAMNKSTSEFTMASINVGSATNLRPAMEAMGEQPHVMMLQETRTTKSIAAPGNYTAIWQHRELGDGEDKMIKSGGVAIVVRRDVEYERAPKACRTAKGNEVEWVGAKVQTGNGLLGVISIYWPPQVKPTGALKQELKEKIKSLLNDERRPCITVALAGDFNAQWKRKQDRNKTNFWDEVHKDLRAAGLYVDREPAEDPTCVKMTNKGVSKATIDHMWMIGKNKTALTRKVTDVTLQHRAVWGSFEAFPMAAYERKQRVRWERLRGRSDEVKERRYDYIDAIEAVLGEESTLEEVTQAMKAAGELICGKAMGSSGGPGSKRYEPWWSGKCDQARMVKHLARRRAKLVARLASSSSASAEMTEKERALASELAEINEKATTARREFNKAMNKAKKDYYMEQNKSYEKGGSAGVSRAHRQLRRAMSWARAGGNRHATLSVDIKELTDAWRHILAPKQPEFEEEARAMNEIVKKKRRELEVKQQGGDDTSRTSSSESIDDKEYISARTVLEAAQRLKTGKASDTEGMAGEAFKYMDGRLAARLARQFNDIITGRRDIPQSWREAELVMIEKEIGERVERKATDYRPIAILSICRKLFERCCLIYMDKIGVMSTTLSNEQAGFRCGRSVIDQLLLIQTCNEKADEKGEPLWVALLDLKKFFDIISHDAVHYGLLRAHEKCKAFDFRIIDCLLSLCKRQRRRIRAPGNTEFIELGSFGVSQGGPLSPVLAILAMEVMIEALRGKDELGVGDIKATGGAHDVLPIAGTKYAVPGVDNVAETVLVEETRVACMAYADDFAVVRRTNEALQDAVHNVERVGKYLNARFSPAKCETTVIGRQSGEEVMLRIYGKDVPQRYGPRYLGTRLLPARATQGGRQLARDVLRDGKLLIKTARWALRGVGRQLTARMLYTCLYSTVFYAAEVGGAASKGEVDKLLASAAKMVLGVPMQSSSKEALAILGWPNVWQEELKRLLRLETRVDAHVSDMVRNVAISTRLRGKETEQGKRLDELLSRLVEFENEEKREFISNFERERVEEVERRILREQAAIDQWIEEESRKVHGGDDGEQQWPASLQSEQSIEVYTDGACQGGARERHAGMGVWFGNGDERNVSRPLDPREPQTNQRAELRAVLLALELTTTYEVVRIYSDSMYVIMGINRHMAGWRADDWRTSTGGRLEHKDVWRRIYEVWDKAKHRISWIKAHDGHEGNESADRLATMAAHQASKGLKMEEAKDDRWTNGEEKYQAHIMLAQDALDRTIGEVHPMIRAIPNVAPYLTRARAISLVPWVRRPDEEGAKCLMCTRGHANSLIGMLSRCDNTSVGAACATLFGSATLAFRSEVAYYLVWKHAINAGHHTRKVRWILADANFSVLVSVYDDTERRRQVQELLSKVLVFDNHEAPLNVDVQAGVFELAAATLDTLWTIYCRYSIAVDDETDLFELQDAQVTPAWAASVAKDKIKQYKDKSKARADKEYMKDKKKKKKEKKTNAVGLRWLSDEHDENAEDGQKPEEVGDKQEKKKYEEKKTNAVGLRWLHIDDSDEHDKDTDDRRPLEEEDEQPPMEEDDADNDKNNDINDDDDDDDETFYSARSPASSKDSATEEEEEFHDCLSDEDTKTTESSKQRRRLTSIMWIGKRMTETDAQKREKARAAWSSYRNTSHYKNKSKNNKNRK